MVANLSGLLVVWVRCPTTYALLKYYSTKIDGAPY